MRRQETEATDRSRFPAGVPRLSGLRSQMTLTSIGVIILLTAVILSIRLIIYFVLQEPRQDLTPSKYIGSVMTPIAVLIGTITGLAASRSPVGRMKRLVTATKEFAAGNSAERVQVTRHDEIGQLEHQFNVMAQQIVESAAQQRLLVEQNARLAERARISRDLHDSVKQHLFAVALQVGVALAQMDNADERTRRHLREADTLISLAQQELTAIIHQLRPTALGQKALPEALREYAQDWARQHDIALDLRAEDAMAIPQAVEEAFWPVAVEALSNVARHSQASSVRVTLAADAERVTLEITDDGSGFDMGVGERSGVGLHSMRERLEALGGAVTIESGSGAGTRVFAQAPISPPQSDAVEAGDNAGSTAPSSAAKEATP
jgi:NarL family two-component system sensor histidine kinase LiaS